MQNIYRESKHPLHFHINGEMDSAALSTCSRVLDRSTSALQSSNELLQLAIKDVARLRKVLNIQKVFGVVPERDIEAAKECAKTSSHPQIKELRERIYRDLDRLKRKREILKNKSELQKVRLHTAEKNAVDSGNDSPAVAQASEPQIARLKLLRNKKDRLKYTLSRLKLQQTRTKLSAIPALPPG